MSHYITTDFRKARKEGAELSSGVSWRTLSALEESGIDINALYGGEEHHAGMSGDGSEVEVSHVQYTKAYQTVIAWVIAMRTYYPKACHQEYGEIGQATVEATACLMKILRDDIG